jgi:hypothetical protein
VKREGVRAKLVAVGPLPAQSHRAGPIGDFSIRVLRFAFCDLIEG